MNARQRPNVVFLMLDTLSADCLRMYGGDIRMRNLEEMAGKGTVYDNAIAPGTYTLTSHVSMFTGKRVREVRSLVKNPVRNHHDSTDPLFLKNKYIKDSEPTLASQMSYLGYRTSLFSNNPFITPSTGLSNGFAYIRNIFLENKLKYHKTTLRIIGNDFLRDNLSRLAYHISSAIPQDTLDNLYVNLRASLNRKVCRETGAYLLDQGAGLTNDIVDRYLSGAGSRGHFMFINYMEAHENYPTNMVTRKEVSQDRWMYVSGMIGPEDAGILRKAYAKRLEYLDYRIGKLMRILKENGVLDNAVVVMASDHGQAFMEHGQLYHTLFPYNEISHVPLIATRWRDGRQESEGRRIPGPVSLRSIYGSMLDIGYGRTDRLNGTMLGNGTVFSDHTGMLDVWDIPLLRVFRNRSRNAERLYRTKLKYNTFATALYSGRYKLMHYYGRRGKDELYDLASDPRETDNIIGKRRDVAHRLLDANKAG